MVRNCIVCGKFLNPAEKNHRGRHSDICEDIKCKRIRKRKWQRKKMQTDPAYKGNQKAAQQKWHTTHPNYWRDYRASHTPYTERNRKQQRLRNATNRDVLKMDTIGDQIATMDLNGSQRIKKQVIIPGRYLIRRIIGGIATMDGMVVELTEFVEIERDG